MNPNNQRNIIILEDDAETAEQLEVFFRQKSIQSCVCCDVSALQKILKSQEKSPDLFLLDWNLPDGDGLQVCAKIRKQWPDVPVIILTVRNMSQDIIIGLRMGADDFISKPFIMEVLYAKMQALWRRSSPVFPGSLTCGSIKMDPETRQVWVDGRLIDLKAREMELLEILIRHKNQILSREQLKEMLLLPGQEDMMDNTLTVLVKRLRQALGSGTHIQTLRSLGYRLREDV